MPTSPVSASALKLMVFVIAVLLPIHGLANTTVITITENQTVYNENFYAPVSGTLLICEGSGTPKFLTDCFPNRISDILVFDSSLGPYLAVFSSDPPLDPASPLSDTDPADTGFTGPFFTTPYKNPYTIAEGVDYEPTQPTQPGYPTKHQPQPGDHLVYRIDSDIETPEPSSLVLFGTGLAGIGATLRRRWRGRAESHTRL